jgi:signal transduction histidine kinase/ActR/RegA family two-component response regulator
MHAMERPLDTHKPSVFDTSFTLDQALLEQRRSESARRLYTWQVPVLRAIGFVIVCAILLLQGLAEGRLGDALPWLVLFNLVYAFGAWIALRAGYGRTGRLDLGLLLFHLDVVVWLLNLSQLDRINAFFAYLLLVRVVDQVGFSFRRALYFAHLLPLAYLAYALVISALQPGQVPWPQRFTITATLYALGLYLAATGLVTERLRNRTRQAMRAARGLVESLEQKAAALESQAAELIEARRQADQANLAKSRFLAVTSHEIRTPMNGILGTTELLMETPLTAVQRRYVQTAHRSATSLLALINDVLDLSRIEAGRLRLEVVDADIKALIDEAVDLIAVTARDRPVELRCSVSPRLPRRVMTDPTRLRQLLVNLLHNAVKFTEQGHVDLSVQVLEESTTDLRVRFSVRDTGIGVAEEQLAQIFQAFEQADSSSTRRFGGSGLGLAIVRELAELMGGTIGVESQVGAGSHFWVDLTLQRATELTPSRLQDLDVAADDDEVAVSVLLVEDDLVNQMIVRDMLTVLGCEVHVADDGQQARAVAAQGRFDIVFMDCHMPVMDGYEATRLIREDERQRGGVRRPIVALTADTLLEDREHCMAAGMDDFLNKPISRAQLAAAILQWTGHRTRSTTRW